MTARIACAILVGLLLASCGKSGGTCAEPPCSATAPPECFAGPPYVFPADTRRGALICTDVAASVPVPASLADVWAVHACADPCGDAGFHLVTCPAQRGDGGVRSFCGVEETRFDPSLPHDENLLCFMAPGCSLSPFQSLEVP